MNWFRKHVKTGSRLALFALAIQFALSFGHFHAFAAQAAPAIQTGLTQGDLDHAARSPPRCGRQSAQQQQPSDHRPAPGRRLRDLRRHLAGRQCPVRDAAAAAAAAGDRTAVSDDRRRVRSSELGASAFQSRAPPALLTSIDSCALGSHRSTGDFGEIGIRSVPFDGIRIGTMKFQRRTSVPYRRSKLADAMRRRQRRDGPGCSRTADATA